MVDFEVLNLPPFPALAWDDYYWTAEINLSAWSGFGKRLDHLSNHPEKLSNGRATLCVESSENGPTPEQCNSFQFLLSNQEMIRTAILNEIFQKYSGWAEKYNEFLIEMLGADKASYAMPKLQKPEDLQDLIRLNTVYVRNESLNGKSYIGFGLNCTWDAEHGLGVTTRGVKVVDIGGHDINLILPTRLT